MAKQAALPTYRTVAAVLEGHTGSGIRLAGWTLLRTIMIAPPMMVVGVPVKQAFFGASIASVLISGFTLLRIFDARESVLNGSKPLSAYGRHHRSLSGHGRRAKHTSRR